MEKLKIIGMVSAFFLLFGAAANAASRTALVIGNSNYKSAPLENPANDAEDVAEALRRLDYEVIEKIDASRREMDAAVQEFYNALNSSGAGLFYYAGHGVQIDGENYLVPVDISVDSAADIKYRAIRANWILAKMEDAKSRVNIVILDACREDPFRRVRGTGEGLAPIQSVRGSFVAYATSPGSVAHDGTGRNGVYTKHLLKAINKPGLTVEETFREVRKGVAEETDYQQIPWDSSSLMGEFYLAGADAVVEQPSADSSGTGTLKIRTTPTDAEVSIDRSFKGTSPRDVHGLDAGPHTIRAEKDGYAPKRKKVRVRSGRTATVRLYLDKEEQTGRLFVHPTPDDADVKIMNIGPPYHEGIELAPGKYQVRVEKNGYENREQWETVQANEDLDVYIELEQKQSEPVPSYPQPGDSWTEPVTGMEFVWVEGGCYMMGSPLTGKPDQISFEDKPLWYKTLAAVSCLLPVGCVSSSKSFYELHGYSEDETPAHQVCVDGFWMGKYEVTIDQYRKYLQASGNKSGVAWEEEGCPVDKEGSYPLAGNRFSRSGSQPMVEVTWHGAKAFSKWLSERTGKTFRLPTETEWEYAARSGGKKEKYAGSNNVGRVAWYGDNSNGRTHRVGKKAPNGLGLYDMTGNVWEWCEDVYDEVAYSKHSGDNPLILSDKMGRVNRGGSWNYTPLSARTTNRYMFSSDCASSIIGFRLCLSRVR